MPEQEYRKIVNIHPVQLKKKDILELSKIITEYEKSEENRIEICIGFNDQKTSLNSVAELENFEINVPLKEISLKSTIWDNHNIIGGISITFYHNYANYHIYSKNKTWFLGKQEQLKEALNNLRPWYWVIKKYIHELHALIFIFSFFILFIGITNVDVITILIGTLLFSFTMMLIHFEHNNRLLPYVKFSLEDKKWTIFSYDSLVLIFGAISTIAAIAQTVHIIKNWS